jgi:thiamine pyrophosphate-dependent acetolactate synthase large subunit-like protein
MNGFEAIANILKKEGFEWMACFPANPLIEAAANAGIRPIVFRQERGGIMAADGFSRMLASQGKRGVFCCQGGPGVENSFGGIAQAWADSVPILFLPAGDRDPDIEPNFSAPKNYGQITKWAASINSAEDIPNLMRRAMSALINGRPGPVLLEMKGKAMAQTIDNIDDYSSPQITLSAPNNNDIKNAVSNVIKAKNPIIWAGQGTLYAGATNEFKELVELLQVPVLTTMQAKSAFDKRHPLSLGSANRTAPKTVWHWLKESDLVLGIGTSWTKTNFAIDIPDGKFLIHNTNNIADISKEYKTDIGLLGDAKLTLDMLIEETKAQLGSTKRNNDSVIESIAIVKKEWNEEWSELLNSDQTPINPYRLVNEINKAVDHENTIITHDAGHPRDQIMPFYPATVPHSYIGWGKSTHLGYGIGLAIGAKIANPDKFCVNFMGDAAFGMAGLDIETSVRSAIPKAASPIKLTQNLSGFAILAPIAKPIP